MVFLCFSQNLNYAIGWTVIHSLWQAFLITIIVGIAMITMQKKTANLRYLLTNIGLWSVLLAAFVTFYIYYDFSRQPGDFVFVPDTDGTSILQGKGVGEFADNATIAPSGLAIEPMGFSWEGFKNYCNSNMYLIVSLWFMGVIFFVLKILGSISYVYYLRNRMNFPADEYWHEIMDGMRQKLNIKKQVDLVESAFVRSPIVVGHLKPMILFPIGAINRLNTNEVEAILAHELAHVMRHDYFFNILQNVIEALFYYHPAVWWLSSQIRTERENCCDDIAISVCGNAMTYAKSLVSVQEMAYYSPQMAMAFAGTSRKKQLLLRVQRILNQPKSTLNMMEKLASTSILLLLLVGFVYGGNHLGNSSPYSLVDSIYAAENTDNQEVANSNKVYLKYDNNGELDSLPVDKHVADGNYSFVNNLYSVDMTVKNQHVTAFKINGLEVDKKDMPKFGKMINELVTNKSEKEDDITVSRSNSRNNITNNNRSASTNYNINNNQIVAVSPDGMISELKIGDDGSKVLLIHRKKQEPLTVTLHDNGNTILIGGIKSSLSQLKKLGWTVKNRELQPIDGFQGTININSNNGNYNGFGSYNSNDEPQPCQRNESCVEKFQDEIDELRSTIEDYKNDEIETKLMSLLNRELDETERKLNKKGVNFNDIQGKIDDITGKLDDVVAELDRKESEKDQANNGRFSYTVSSNSDDEDNGDGASVNSWGGVNNTQLASKFDNWLVNELKNDGYLSNTKTYNFVWNERYMRVAGKTVSDKNRLKYVAMHQRITGNPMGKTFTITRNVSGN